MNLKQLLDKTVGRAKPVGKDNLRSGMTVRVHSKIKEGDKERIQVYEGLIIGVHHNGADTTITVRKMASGVGVEKIFLLGSPLIDKIEVVKIAKVRRSKLYYMRNLTGKSARLKERRIGKEEMEKMNVVAEEAPAEVADEKVEGAPVEEKKSEEKEEEAPVEVADEKVEGAPVEEKKSEEKEEEAPAEVADEKVEGALTEEKTEETPAEDSSQKEEEAAESAAE